MSRYFIACELGEHQGRIMLGTLHQQKLTLSQVRRFENVPIRDGASLQWDAAQLYQDLLLGLRDVGAYDEPVEGISCTAWPADYLLFHADASFIPPTWHYRDPRTRQGEQEMLDKIPWEAICAETGVLDRDRSTLFQLAAEKSKRLKRADHLMPVADGMNFLLSGVACIERSSASVTQLLNPTTGQWSELLLNALRLPPKLLPQVVPAGTRLKQLRPEIAKATGLEDPRIVASCSNELAAAVAGLPATGDEPWAFLRLGTQAMLGAEHPETIQHEPARALGISNVLGYGGTAVVHQRTMGLWLVEECRRFWAETDRGLDDGVLMHLAASAPPLESLLNLDDPRFATPGDLPLKVRAYCKETGQPEPRKPGPILRCVLESLALHYRKQLNALSAVTGREYHRLYLWGDTSNHLLKHFIANALQLPVVIVPTDEVARGNVLVQTVSLGYVPNLAQARQIVRDSFKMETIQPHNPAWALAYERLLALSSGQHDTVAA